MLTTGIPFLPLGRQVLHCQFGVERNHEKKHSDTSQNDDSIANQEANQPHLTQQQKAHSDHNYARGVVEKKSRFKLQGEILP